MKPFYRVNQDVKENANNEQGPTPSNISAENQSEETASTKVNSVP